jgi:hypothetical protein
MFVIFCAYTGGRVHQWYRQSLERDTAFREGYDQASRALFPLASRSLHGQAPRVAERAGPGSGRDPGGTTETRAGNRPDDLRRRTIRLEPKR